MKTISDSLKLRQAKQREETLSKVKQAMEELSLEGYQITIKNLMERTGLSRAVFSKAHVKDILDQGKHLACREKTLAFESRSSKDKDCQKIAAKLEKMKLLNEENTVKIARLQNELIEKRGECELLRGQLHIIMQKCRIKGIEISE